MLFHGMVISPKGVLFGLGLSFLGTLIYLAFLIRIIVRRSHLVVAEGSVGIDVVSLFRVMLHTTDYWVLALSLLLLGCAIVSLWQRPAIPPQ